jgi:hypothetical protein
MRLRGLVVVTRRWCRSLRCPCRPLRPLDVTLHGCRITNLRILAIEGERWDRISTNVTEQVSRFWRRREDEQMLPALRRIRQIPDGARQLELYLDVVRDRVVPIMVVIHLIDGTATVKHNIEECKCGDARDLLGQVSITQVLYPILHPSRGCAKLRESLAPPSKPPEVVPAAPPPIQSTWV